MCSFEPTIGITLSSRADADAGSRAATARYVAAVEAHGARAVLLKPGNEPATLEGLDGLLLAGGGDLDPAWYWQAPHPLLDRVEHDRDAMELTLVQEAVKAGLPTLGICRGAQVLGVALGGRLYQDIGSCVRGALAHGSVEGRAVTHRVRLAEDCRLRRVFGQAEVHTNSFHHQANAELGARARAVAWSDDGVVEAIEGTGEGFVIGVQWHPERMAGEDPVQARLFAAFVEESKRRRLGTAGTAADRERPTAETRE